MNYVGGHSVVRIKIGAPVVHNIHSCEQIHWKASYCWLLFLLFILLMLLLLFVLSSLVLCK